MKKNLKPNFYRILRSALCTIVAIMSCATLYAQEAKVTVKADNITIEQLLSIIESQTNKTFAYTADVFNPNQTISVDAKDQSITELLKSVIPNVNITSEKNKIFIIKRPPAPIIKVSGNVTDRYGNPLIGATIMELGTTNGTVTAGGDYAITVPSDATLVFSYMGYETEQMAVNGATKMNVILHDNQEVIDDVVVVAFGSRKKSDVIGSIATVKGSDLNNSAGGNFQTALQGMAAGLQIVTDGITGNAPQIKVRGISSISSSTEPLWVVDGVVGGVNTLGMNDIESINVLKDASATAMYGSRGSNGVIIVTTKRGKKGASSFNVSYEMGVTPIINTDIGLASTKQTFEMMDTARANSQLKPELFDPQTQVIDVKWGGWEKGLTREEAMATENNIVDKITRVGSFRDLNISASRGGDSGNTYASFNYRDDKSSFVGLDSKKLGARLNSEYIKGGFKLGAQIATTYREKSDLSNWGYYAQPWFPLYDADSESGYWNTYVDDLNPLVQMDPEFNQRDTKAFDIRATYYMDYKFQHVKGLSFRADATLNFGHDQLYTWTSRLINPSAITQGTKGSRYKQNSFGQSYQGYMTFDRSYGKHNINVVGGATMGTSYNDQIYLMGNNLVGKFQEMAYVGSIDASSNAMQTGENYTMSFISRAEYQYDNKYLLGVSFVREGSSRFTKDNRWGNFYSASAGWNIAKENFMSGTKDWLSVLKLRGSFGETGNQNIPDQASRSLYASSGEEGYNYESFMYQYSISNKDVTWEKTQSIDFGVDFGLFKNRVNGSIAYYRQNTYDMLLSIPLPASAGLPTENFANSLNSIWGNVGDMYNQGFEIDLSYNVISKKDFSWTTNLNITTNKNQVTSLHESLDKDGSGIVNAKPGTITKKGLSIGTYYMPEWAGVDPATGVGTIYAIDLDHFEKTGETRKTGEVVPATNDNCELHKMILKDKTGLPTSYGSWSNNFKYKNFDASFQLYWSLGNYIYNATDYFKVGGDGDGIKSNWLANSWKQPGDIAEYPQVRYTDQYSVGSDWSPAAKVQYASTGTGCSKALQDASFLRLKNITVGYNLPDKTAKRIGVSNLRVYVSATNLLTFTKFKGYDPELSLMSRANDKASGIMFLGTQNPQTAIYSAGINLQF